MLTFHVPLMCVRAGLFHYSVALREMEYLRHKKINIVVYAATKGVRGLKKKKK